MADSLSDDAWFAGFVDGEASFLIARQTKGRACNPDRFFPAFQVTLRADDLAILQELQGEFGGGVHPSRRADPGPHPCYIWGVRSKADMTRLVAYFERFPLRAKKRNDYFIWRRAVEAYCRDGGAASELPILREALIAGRAYRDPDGAAPDLPVTQSPQLRLVG